MDKRYARNTIYIEFLVLLNKPKELYRALPASHSPTETTEPYGAQQSSTELYGALRSPTEPYGALRSPTKSYGALQSRREPYRALQSPTEHYRVLQSPTEPYGVLKRYARNSIYIQFPALLNL